MKKRTFITALIISALLCLAGAVAFVESTQANPIINVYHDIPPPAGTEPPVVTIHTPTNGSSYPKSTMLTFDVAVPQTNCNKSLDMITKIYYHASWTLNEITVAENAWGTFSIDLSNVGSGNHSVTIYAVGIGYIETGEEYKQENNIVWSYNYRDRFEMTNYATVNFLKDHTTPQPQSCPPQTEPFPQL